MRKTRSIDSEIILDEKDPLLRFLSKRVKLTNTAVYSLAVALNAIPIFGIGSIVSYLIHKNENIVRPFDFEHTSFTIPLTLLFFPLIALMYAWQPNWVVQALNVLQANKVIIEPEPGKLLEFKKKMKVGIDNRIVVAISVILVIVFLILQTFVVYPSEFARREVMNFWFSDKYYYASVFLPVQFIMFYVVAMVALKGILILFWVDRMFKEFGARVRPLHPDGAGGFGALGNLAIKYSWVAVFLGGTAATVTIVRVAIGAGWAHIDLIILYILYFILVPVFLLTPMWSAHKSMLVARDKKLLQISKKFEDIIQKSSDVESLKDTKEKLEELKGQYELIKATYPTWPISFDLLKKFSFPAILPLITGIASIIVDVLIKFFVSR